MGCGCGGEAPLRTLDDFLVAVDAGLVAASCTSGSWDGAASRFSDAQYARSCVLDRADCSADWREKPAKQRYSLPIREPGGAINTTAVSSARGRLNQTNACSEAKSKAEGRLDRAASACGMSKEKAMSENEFRVTTNLPPMQSGSLVVPSTTAGNSTFWPLTPVIHEGPGEEIMAQEQAGVDARIVSQLAAVAGRPWCLKPESMDIIVGALSGPILAHEVELDEPIPSAERYGSIAVIPLQGLITPAGGGDGLLGMLLGIGGGLQQFRQDLREAVADPDVKRVVLKVDSPGGLVDQVPETAAAVRVAREKKPITAVASTQAASAAYWIASQADDLVVTPSGEVGSVGVYMLHTDKSKALENEGLKVTMTSAGKYKTEGNPYEPMSDSAKAAKQRKVNQVYEKFVTDVSRGRRADREDVRNGYGEGRTLLAEDAVEQGLADRVGTFEAVLSEVGREVRQAAQTERIKSLDASRGMAALDLG